MWFTSADGSQIAGYDLGGQGRPLLLSHATGFHAHVWMPIVEHLTDTFHCYGFDQRGHGATPPPVTGDFDWHRSGEDALAVAAGFGLEQPLVAGHSAGGAVLLLAEEDHPGSWSAAWTFEPVIPEALTPAGSIDGQNPLSAGARKRRARFESFDVAYANFASKPPFGAFDPTALRAYVDHGFTADPDGGVVLACRPEDEAATYDQAFASRAWDHLDAIHIPVHVVCGAVSTHLPAQLMAGAVERLPNGTLEVLDDLGHFAPMEDPVRVAKSIRETLD